MHLIPSRVKKSNLLFNLIQYDV